MTLERFKYLNKLRRALSRATYEELIICKKETNRELERRKKKIK